MHSGFFATIFEAGFNEAAGIHRRKRNSLANAPISRVSKLASMRPPEFTGGNGDSRR